MSKKGKPASTVQTEAPAPKTVPPDKLRWNCPASWLGFKSTARVTPATGIVGQDKAVEVLEKLRDARGPDDFSSDLETRLAWLYLPGH